MEESKLLLQTAEGNEEAFTKLFYLYHQQLGLYLYKITESIELSEEITQDVFLKIWMARESLIEVKCFKAYLFVMSKNHALNSLRKIAGERSKKIEWESIAISSCKFIDENNQQDVYDLVDSAISQLPPQQKKVYLLSRHQRMKYHEIAEELGLSKETVKKYMQLAVGSITTYVRGNLYSLFFFLSLAL